MKESVDKERELLLRWIDEDRDEIIAFLSKLVQCKTPSPIGDTRAAVALIGDFLSDRGLGYEVLAYCKTMPNLLASFGGEQEGAHLMLHGHLDVLPAGREAGWQDDPWSGAISQGRVWGRGTSDMKAGVTAMLFAYSYLYRLRDKLSGKLSLALVADEETGWGRGTGFLFDTVPERMIADCVLTGEPSGMGAISFASKGYLSLVGKVVTRGAIAGYSHESPSAIELACQVIQELKELERETPALPEELEACLQDEAWCEVYSQVRPSLELAQLRRVTVDVCTIQGGSMVGVIPADCTFSVAVVFPLGVDVDLLRAQIAAIADRHSELTWTIEGVDLPELSDPAGAFPRLLQGAAESVGRACPLLTPDIALSDCRYWRYRGIPAYWYGSGGEACSAANESVSIDELLDTVRIHALAGLAYLRR